MRREAERCDAKVVAVIEDNDLSGSGRAKRLGFDRLVEMIDGRAKPSHFDVGLETATQSVKIDGKSTSRKPQGPLAISQQSR